MDGILISDVRIEGVHFPARVKQAPPMRAHAPHGINPFLRKWMRQECYSVAMRLYFSSPSVH